MSNQYTPETAAEVIDDNGYGTYLDMLVGDRGGDLSATTEDKIGFLVTQDFSVEEVVSSVEEMYDTFNSFNK